MIRKLKIFFRLSRRRQALLCVTVLLSLYTFLLMRFFRKHARFDRTKRQSERVNELLVRDIRWAIFTTSRWVPWENVCRHQAYQAMLLCRYYRQPYRIYIGFRKSPESGKVEGHAWTTVDGEMITGFCKPEEYTVQSIFSGE